MTYLMNNKKANNPPIQLSFFTLLLLISFASVNAVLFTPALPAIKDFFHISDNSAQQTITWFLVGYAVGQLLYGPIANRYGRKPALYVGISIQIVSSLICVLSGIIHLYGLLIFGRLVLALGSGVGLKMTFTLVNETYESKLASQKLSYLMLAFAITPGLSVALGGLLTTYFGWMSCFYVGALYGVILMLLVMRLPETVQQINPQALQFKQLWHGYGLQFSHRQLVLGGLLMGSSTCFIYVFASLSPFIAMNLLGMSSTAYGLANLLPSIGLILGSLCGAQLIKRYSLMWMLNAGVAIIAVGSMILLALVVMGFEPIISIFLPMIIIYFGLCFIFSNASVVALATVNDKAHGSAVMSFLNMGFATIVVLLTEYFSVSSLLLPEVYIVACVLMFGLLMMLKRSSY